MSLYNSLCGNNPLFEILHAVLATAGELPYIPRYRDTYTAVNAAGVPRIVIYTRTGGGNRPGYADQNKALAAHPLYLGDRDDSFDSTFAHFEFAVPADWADRVLRLHSVLSRVPKGQTPIVKFNRAMLAIENKPVLDTTPPTDDECLAFAQLVGDMAIELKLLPAVEET